MYRNEKKGLLDICDTMREIHTHLPATDIGEERAELLDACQQGAIRIGEGLEAEDKVRFEAAVHRLEEYCEAVYRISESEAVSEDDISRLDSFTDEIKEVLSSIRTRIKIVFFPYKAEMWDSLESFYLAAREDPECDAFLVPIPYYEFDKKQNKMVSRYDGDRFPADENPIPFNRFDHKDGSIDIAYVHNPYDNQNLVTSIYPEYYSSELRKYVRKLVYTPYFVTNGSVSDEQKDLPVYRNMDYEILQSEYAKKCCEGMYYYDKILPFGSSKFDLVINKCRRGVNMPEEWKEIIGDRRTLMLNSSINDLLTWNEAALDKLDYFFSLIKNNKQIAVIWRPHPLYESTFRSMRPELLEKYEEIKKRFIEEKIGVFDTCPDISDTVAIADGYIGSGASSVINLFAVTGKPVFIFNNALRESSRKVDRRIVELSGMDYLKGRLYLHTTFINAIFSIDINNITAPLRYEGSVPDVVNWTHSLYGMGRAGDKLYMAPFFAEDAVRYDPLMKNVETLGSVGRQYDVRFMSVGSAFPSRKSVFFLPVNNKYLVMEYVVKTGEWLYHQEPIIKLYEGLERPSYVGMLFGSISYDDIFYWSTGISNRVLKMESITGRYEMLYLGKKELDTDSHIILKGASKEGLWFCMAGDTNIYMAPWENLSKRKEWRIYEMPEDFSYTHDDYGDKEGIHGAMIEYGKYMIVFPHRHPHMIRLDKETGEMNYMAEDFFRDSDKKGIGYELKKSSIVAGGCYIGKDRFATVRSRDLHIAVINLDDGSYEEFVPEIPEEMFDKLVPEDAGFFKGDEYDYFRMQENRLFPLEHFLEVFAKDGYRKVREQQLEALSSLAANLDGTCGIKVHEYLKQVIEAER